MKVYLKNIVCLLLFLIPFTVVKGAASDSIVFKTFGSVDYKASTFNYTGIAHTDGIAYFANESGVLEYDGSQWRLIAVANFSAATALAQVGERIYVGGRDELGYLERDSLGSYQYHSLRHLLQQQEEQLKDIWQIVAVGDNVYFGSLEMILRYDGQALHVIPLKQAYIFTIGKQLFASASKQGLASIRGSEVQFVNTQFNFQKDAAFQYLRGLRGEHLLVTADNGFFEIDTLTYRTKKWSGQANALLAKSSLYSVTVWGDSLYACATYLGGLFVLDQAGNVIKTYNKENGFAVGALRELFKDKRGNLWLTSDNGLHYLHQPALSQEGQALKTIIRHVIIGEQEMPVANEHGRLSTDADYAGSVVFHFATPGYHFDELEYSYYLKGYEHTWSAWKTDTKKEYTNLRGGDYTFHVKARFQQKKESLPAAIDLSIPIPWFKTKTAIFLSLICFGVAIASAVHYRTKKLRMLNKRLSNIISNRTRELVAQREQLRATNNELRVRNTELDNFVYRSSHDLVAPLKSLKGLIHIARHEYEAANRENYFMLMHTSIEKLEDFIKSIMEYSSNTKKEILQVPIHLTEILDNIVAELKYYDKAEKIVLLRKIDPEAIFYSDPKRLKIILSNLITNSIKYHNYYQDNLYIEIKTAPTATGIAISVTDNGRGIEKEYLGKIFDMFFRATDSAQGSGLGLYIVKDTVEKLGGTISVSSEFGKGSTFTLFFPVGVKQEAAGCSSTYLN